MREIKLYNSLKRDKEVFVPLDADHVRVYACGPTVYNYAHIGNARMAVVFDQWARLFRSVFPKVTYVSNITDVEDKIMIAAREQNLPISEITQKYTKIYNDDMAVLGVRLPDIQPKATEHIDEMVIQISQLIDRGHAYEAQGHVLFDVPSNPSYGVLSGRSRDEQVAGARVEVAPYKKDPADFVLWKPSNDDEPGWDSPFGFGRPGWHIECSAMAEKHLGLPFDIHGGGADLKFPHHENEIAQSCCAHGTEHDAESFSKYWIHNGFVTVEGEKMSKSLGNVLLVHDLVENYPGEVLRLALLTGHYRQPLDWSTQRLEDTHKTLDKLYARLQELGSVHAAPDVGVPGEVMDALCDDLNTPQAITELLAIAKIENDHAKLKGQLQAAGHLLGILQQDPAAWFAAQVKDTSDLDTDKIEQLLIERTEARQDKNFGRADEIRDILTEMGVGIEDSADGPKWYKL